MKIHLLSGFLGSGKTTAIQSACQAMLKQGLRPAVVTNDQGSRLVDNDFFGSLDIPGRQVTNGCFCCNYEQLDAQLRSLQEDAHPDVLFAESVGSCTDIVATVLKPLRKYQTGSEVTLSVFADIRLLNMLLAGEPQFKESVTYIYFKQLEEAPVIILSKTDLASAAEIESVTTQLRERYPNKTILHQNSFDHSDIAEWLRILDGQKTSPAPASLELDYDIYGEGEALLAWLDEDLEITTTHSNAPACAAMLINTLYAEIFKRGFSIGHLKFLLNNERKLSFVQSPEAHPPVEILEKGAKASLLVNARVQTDPGTLSAIVRDAIAATEHAMDCTVAVNSFSSFQPGYPKPTHRIKD